MSERAGSHDRRPGFPDNEDDVINNYGTYNIQPTADTHHSYPMIAQGLAKEAKAKLDTAAKKKHFPMNEQ